MILTEPVLVTGATGFIGINLVRKMLSRRQSVNAISLHGGRIDQLDVEAIDCCDRDKLLDYVSSNKPSGIIHLAAKIPESSSIKDQHPGMLDNVLMIENVLHAARMNNIPQVIYASSTSVYDTIYQLPITEKSRVNPIGFYALSKYLGELICQEYARQYNIAISCLRISAPYGPHMIRDTVVGVFIKCALAKKRLTIWDSGERTQDFTYVEDVCDGILKAYEYKARGVFNISSGSGTSMNMLAKVVLDTVGNDDQEIEHVYHGELESKMIVSHNLASSAFGYNPVHSIRSGVKEYVDWIRRNSA